MRTQLLTLQLVGFLLFLVPHGRSDASRKQPELAGYDRFGPYTIRLGEDPTQVHAELREFLWTHWHERRLGYAVVTEYTVAEGRACRTTYFVEPGKGTGAWHIKMEWQITKGSYLKKEKFIAVSITRMAVDSRGKETGDMIPDTEDRAPGSYVLQLEDKHGKVFPGP